MTSSFAHDILSKSNPVPPRTAAAVVAIVGGGRRRASSAAQHFTANRNSNAISLNLCY
jgi:hypothetical protein